MLKKILIAEDEKQNQLLLKRISNKLNYDPVIVDDGAQVLLEIGKEHFSVVILDYSMPVLDGIETLKQIRKMNDKVISTLPVIIVSGKDIDEIKEMTKDLNVTGIITKPFRFDEIKNVLNTIE